MKKSLLLFSALAGLLLSSCSFLPSKKDSSSSGTNTNTTGTSDTGSGSDSGSGSNTDTDTDSGSHTQGDVTVTLNVTSISLDVNPAANKKTIDVTATVTAPAGADKTVKWTTDNASFATAKVSPSDNKVATVTAVYAGSTTLRAEVTYNNEKFYGTCPITVVDTTPIEPTITGLSFSPTDLDPILDVGEHITYQVNVAGTDGSEERYNRKANFEIDHSDVVQMDVDHGDDALKSSKVTLTALKGGDARITVTAQGNSNVKDYIDVVVLPGIVEILSIVSKPSTVALNSEIALNSVLLEVRLDNNTTKEVHPDRIEVDTSSLGSTTATAYIDGITNGVEFSVTVYTSATNKITFTDKAFADASSLFVSDKDGAGFEGTGLSRGIQVNGSTYAQAHSSKSLSGIKGIGVCYSSNGGTGSITVKVGAETALEVTGIASGRHVDYDVYDLNSLSGTVDLKITHSGNDSIYIESITFYTEHTMTGIRITDVTSVNYHTNDNFDLSRYTVVPVYSDGEGTALTHDEHLYASLSSEYKLTPSDQHVTIYYNDGSQIYSVNTDIVVTDIVPEGITASFKGETDVSGHINVTSDELVELKFDITVDVNATYKDYEWVSSSTYVSGTGGSASGESIVTVDNIPSGTGTFIITVRYTHNTDISQSFTIYVIDKDAPTLNGVVVSQVSGVVSPQYVGYDPDLTGLKFVAIYSWGPTHEVSANEINWNPLVAGEAITGIYTDSSSQSVTVTVSGYIEVRNDTLTVTISGTMTTTVYSIDDSWDPTGLTVSFSYESDSEKPYTGGYDFSFSPATPFALGVGENQDLTVTATADDGSGANASTTVQVTVNKIPDSSTGLQQGEYYLKIDSRYFAAEDGMTTNYSEKAATTANVNEAATLTLKLVSDDVWTLQRANGDYLTYSGSSTNLKFVSQANFNASKDTISISWNSAGTARLLKLNASSTTRYLAMSSNKIGAYAANQTYSYNIDLIPVHDVESITSITGHLNAAPGQAWSTENLFVSGYYEGQSGLSNLTDLVNLVITPELAYSEKGTYYVSVKATLKANSSITYTDTHVEARVIDQAWTLVSNGNQISDGDQIVIVAVSESYSKILTTINDNDQGFAETFDPFSEDQYDFTIVKNTGAISRSYSFKVNAESSNKYLAHGTMVGSSAFTTTSSTGATSTAWSIDISSNNAEIKGSGCLRYIRYDESINKFIIDTASNQSAVQIYKKA